MKQTYLFTKDSTLMAFEGPVKPKMNAKFEPHNKGKLLSWESEMSTARESALPVVNADHMGERQD